MIWPGAGNKCRYSMRVLAFENLRAVFSISVTAVSLWTASPATADEALDRCRALTTGMTSEAVAALLHKSVHVGTNIFEQTLPCLAYVTLKGRVWKVQVSEGLGLKPMTKERFAEVVRERTKKWGTPTFQAYKPERAVATWDKTGDVFTYILMIWFGEDFALYEEMTNRTILKLDNVSP